MAETILSHADAEEATLLASVRNGMKELSNLRAEMKQDQEETDRLLAENAVRIANIDAVLDRMASARS